MNSIEIKQVFDDKEKSEITRVILESLTKWFEIKESREKYIRDSKDKDFICAYDNDKPIGFLYLKQTGKDTVELAVMGVLNEYHRLGIGKKLFAKAKEVALDKGYSFIQVKTVKYGVYKEYDITNKFYLSLGFKELEVLPLYWDEANPCQIYIMNI